MPHRIDHRRPVRAPTLAVLTAWRLVVIGFALTGLVDAIRTSSGVGEALHALSQLASLGAAAVYACLLAYPFVTGRRFHEPRSPWWRGAIAVTLVLVMVVYQTLLSGALDDTSSRFEHLLTPLIVLVDVVAVGRNLCNARWLSVLTWLVLPLAYLVYYNAAGLDVYEDSFSLRVDHASFWARFPGFVAGILVTGALLVAIGRVRAAARRPAVVGAEPPAC